MGRWLETGACVVLSISFVIIMHFCPHNAQSTLSMLTQLLCDCDGLQAIFRLCFGAYTMRYLHIRFVYDGQFACCAI